jgi:hypothetical protein
VECREALKTLCARINSLIRAKEVDKDVFDQISRSFNDLKKIVQSLTEPLCEVPKRETHRSLIDKHIEVTERSMKLIALLHDIVAKATGEGFGILKLYHQVVIDKWYFVYKTERMAITHHHLNASVLVLSIGTDYLIDVPVAELESGDAKASLRNTEEYTGVYLKDILALPFIAEKFKETKPVRTNMDSGSDDEVVDEAEKPWEPLKKKRKMS